MSVLLRRLCVQRAPHNGQNALRGMESGKFSHVLNGENDEFRCFELPTSGIGEVIYFLFSPLFFNPLPHL